MATSSVVNTNAISSDPMPKEWVCTNDKCFNVNSRAPEHYSHCPHCGKTLDWRVADIYIDLSLDEWDPIETTQVGIKPEPPPPEGIEHQIDKNRKQRVSLRNFIRIMRKYEEEVVLEDI